MPIKSTFAANRTHNVKVDAADEFIDCDLFLPDNAKAVIVFAHGSGSNRQSPRNQQVAEKINSAGFGTFLIDLLTKKEQQVDNVTRQLRFDISLISSRLIQATDWLYSNLDMKDTKIGFYGASTGAAAAIVAAAERPEVVGAVVSRGGRPDLAGADLSKLRAPTLLIVGELDKDVIELNEKASRQMNCENRMSIVPGATHLFEEPGTMQEVIKLSIAWFDKYLGLQKSKSLSGKPELGV